MVRLFSRARRRTGRNPDGGSGYLPSGGPDAVEVGGRWVRVGEEYAATLAVTGFTLLAISVLAATGPAIRAALSDPAKVLLRE